MSLFGGLADDCGRYGEDGECRGPGTISAPISHIRSFRKILNEQVNSKSPKPLATRWPPRSSSLFADSLSSVFACAWLACVVCGTLDRHA